MSTELELAILGGGCAGLSLARDLSRNVLQTKKLPETLVLEPRPNYENDRTWCYWASASDHDAALVSHSWRAWRFSHHGSEIIHNSRNDLSYHCVPAINFYNDALDAIAAADAVNIQLDTRVESVEPVTGGFDILTNKGRYFAKQLVDSRPPSPEATHSATLLQAFAGVEVECEQALLHRDIVGLMEAMAVDEFGFRFNYVLPLTSRRLLIEATRFAVAPLPHGQIDKDLELALDEIVAHVNYSIVRRERGLIPMGLARDSKPLPTGWVRAGTSGGAVRASTGYAFRRIQDWSKRCVLSLAQSGRVIGQPAESPEIQVMDQVFLNVLRQNPERAPEYFMALANSVPAESLARFLSDQGGYRDLIKVIRALPVKPFLQQTLAGTNLNIAKLLFLRSGLEK